MLDLGFPYAGFLKRQGEVTTKYSRDMDMWTEEELDYGPPTFQTECVQKGLTKYDHYWRSIGIGYYEELLERAWDLVGHVIMRAIPRTFQESWNNLKLDKSIGQPHQLSVGPFKQQWVDCMTPLSTFLYFCFFTCLLNVTKKDEMRTKGKLARIMRPVCVVMAFMGDWLFGGILDEINRSVFQTPSFVGAQIPGSHILELWKRFLAFSKREGARLHDTDMQGHDARAALFLWMLTRDILKRGIPKWKHQYVDRYFDMVFYGWTVAEGGVFMIPGQSTGQTLTAFGNTMCLILMMCLHALESHMSHETFKEEVLFFAFGDDMIYGTTSEHFAVERLNATFMKYGMYLETDSLESKQFEDLTFLSSHPVWRKHGMYKELVYKFNTSKLVSSFHYTRSSDPNINMSRYVSLCLGMWGDQAAFSHWSARVVEWYKQSTSSGTLFDEGSRSLLALLTSDKRIRRIYCPCDEGVLFSSSF